MEAPDNTMPLPTDEPDDRPLLLSAIRDLFPAPAVTAAIIDFSALPPLFPDEEASVAQAVPKRILEFRAGRHCARLAMRQLGIPPQSLPRRPDRTPAWPSGIVGSIGHCAGFCGAVVAPSETLSGVGFDVEERHRIQPKLWPKIATEDELAQLHDLDPEAASRHATLLFSAKESFYKAQYPVTQSFLQFDDVQIDQIDKEGFRIRLTRPVPLLGDRDSSYSGRFRFEKSHILTGVTLFSASVLRAQRSKESQD